MTADSLPFANQQQHNTSRDAKQVLTYKYKEQNGQIRIKGKIKKPEFTLTPIKTGEKTGLQKIAKVGTRRESPLSDDVIGTATSGTTTTPLDMLEATVKDQDAGAITTKASTSISRSHWEDLLQSHGGSKNMFAARDHLADEQEALSPSAFSLNTHNSWSTDTCDKKIDQFYIEHPPPPPCTNGGWRPLAQSRPSYSNLCTPLSRDLVQEAQPQDNIELFAELKRTEDKLAAIEDDKINRRIPMDYSL